MSQKPKQERASHDRIDDMQRRDQQQNQKKADEARLEKTPERRESGDEEPS